MEREALSICVLNVSLNCIPYLQGQSYIEARTMGQVGCKFLKRPVGKERYVRNFLNYTTKGPYSPSKIEVFWNSSLTDFSS